MSACACESPCEQWERLFRGVLAEFDALDLLGLPHQLPKYYDAIVSNEIRYTLELKNTLDKLAHEFFSESGAPPPEIFCEIKTCFNKEKQREEYLVFAMCSQCDKGLVANCTGIHFHPFGTSTREEVDAFLENYSLVSSYSPFHPDFIN